MIGVAVVVGPMPTQWNDVLVHVAEVLTTKVEYTVSVFGRGECTFFSDLVSSRLGMAPCDVGPCMGPQVAVLTVVTVPA